MILNKSIIFIINGILLLLSCNNSSVKNQDIVKKDTVVHPNLKFEDNLIEIPLDSSGFYISIPQGYIIRTMEMSMTYRTMYFFMPSDTSDKAKANGCIVVGLGEYTLTNRNPQERIKSEFLGTEKDWSYYGYNDNNFIEIAAEVEMERYTLGIHANGSAGSRDELTQLLKIYSTFKKK